MPRRITASRGSGLLTKNVTDTTCDAPIRNRSRPYYALSISFGTISAAIVLVRLFSKFFTHSEFGFDDYFIVLTIGTGIPSDVLTAHGIISNGLGRDIWTLTPKQITDFVRSFYAMEILYFSQVALLKLSLLCFYLRIFPGPKIRRLLWTTIIFDLCFGTVFVLAAIFQCRPISYYWKNWDGEHQGTCLNANGLGWSNAAISILLDVWMLGLPLSQLPALQLHWKKKLGVTMMFVVGTFVTVVSILRLQSLLHFAKSSNPTWDNLAVSQWSTVEINVGIICACMPSLRALLVRLFPKILGTTQNSKSAYYGNNSRSYAGGNISVNRPGKSLNSGKHDRDGGGIMYSQSYTVQWGEHDEVQLVQLSNLDTEATKSSSRASEEEL
ncbi:hypothetical protein B7463_g8306, partial [Scytalidium lignicola]